jgi:dihydroneopterin triphosphate diphosphatase
VPTEHRRPESVLVVVYSGDGQALLLRRRWPFEFWQSVTGSLLPGETHAAAARRELYEETRLGTEGCLQYSGVSRQFAIDPRWRRRFAPGVVENVEFEWHYRLPEAADIAVQEEHSAYRWVPVAQAAEAVWSWTNRDALWNLAIT